LFVLFYRFKFGVYNVDFDDPSRPRKMKASGAFLKTIFTANGFDAEEDDSCPY
jgi:beta-glucosidase/6-phospho-beta-glucosidase/beta-galactosidase